MNKKLITFLGLVFALALFIMLNILGTALLRGTRVDLTDNKLFTLSKGSKSIASKLDEPIKLTLYYSDTKSSDVPAQIKSYAQRVKELLHEFAANSAGKIKLDIVNPEAFSEAEDKAVADGIFGYPTAHGERFYFGLVGTNSTDKKEVLPTFDPGKEEFLEYDITRLVYLLSNTQKKVVGILSYLPLEGVQNNPLMRGQNTPPWQIASQIKELFEVKSIAPDAAEIPADVKVIFLVHPKGISEKMQYLLDQFVLKGGRMVVAVDPFCEADIPPGINPMQAMSIPKTSDLKKLFEAWGLELMPGVFAGDRKTALQVRMGSENRSEAVTFVAWQGMTKDKGNFDSGDSVTGTLQQINAASPGVLVKKAGATTNFQPLIQTTTESMLEDSKQLEMIPDPKKMLADFKPSGEKYTIAARVSGKVKSAFPNGDPNRPAPAEGQPANAPDPNHVAESKEDINVIVVADCDMLTDRFWINETRIQGMVLGYQKIADNGDFIIGALDNLTGSSDMISVRARGKFQRPFDRVDSIRKDAEQKYMAKQQELDARRDQLLKKIEEAYKKNPQGGNIILSPEQKAEVEKARADMIVIQKERREVQYQLRKDVESLQTRLKVLNIGLMPLCLGILAVGLSAYRVNRRRSVRTAKGLS